MFRIRFSFAPKHLMFGSKDSDSSAGIKVAAGSTWMITRNIGLFGEYRFAHFTADLLGFEQDVKSALISDSN